MFALDTPTPVPGAALLEALYFRGHLDVAEVMLDDEPRILGEADVLPDLGGATACHLDSDHCHGDQDAAEPWVGQWFPVFHCHAHGVSHELPM